jgi:hypothetical protein
MLTFCLSIPILSKTYGIIKEGNKRAERGLIEMKRSNEQKAKESILKSIVPEFLITTDY